MFRRLKQRNSPALTDQPRQLGRGVENLAVTAADERNPNVGIRRREIGRLRRGILSKVREINDLYQRERERTNPGSLAKLGAMEALSASLEVFLFPFVPLPIEPSSSLFLLWLRFQTLERSRPRCNKEGRAPRPGP